MLNDGTNPRGGWEDSTRSQNILTAMFHKLTSHTTFYCIIFTDGAQMSQGLLSTNRKIRALMSDASIDINGKKRGVVRKGSIL